MYEDWPIKGLLLIASLSVKYEILNKIEVSNRARTNHSLGITSSFARSVYQIGTRASFDFGEYVFEQTMKQVVSFAIKLPLYFPSLFLVYWSIKRIIF